MEEKMVEALAALFALHPRVVAPDSTLAARMVVGLLEAATHRWATDRAGLPIDRDVLIGELARMIGAYLSTPGPVAHT
jgi:hypothetical protein